MGDTLRWDIMSNIHGIDHFLLNSLSRHTNTHTTDRLLFMAMKVVSKMNMSINQNTDRKLIKHQNAHFLQLGLPTVPEWPGPFLDLTHGVPYPERDSFCPRNVKIDHRAWIYGWSDTADNNVFQTTHAFQTSTHKLSVVIDTTATAVLFIQKFKFIFL